VPVGFGHGFCVTSEIADFVYKCTAYYDQATESGFRFDDPDVGIEWPDVELLYSERDRTAPRLAEIADGLPF
jgi:dTDP-4-dehydrorhamnose 3,5-epimerase